MKELSPKAIEILKKKANISEDVDCEINRVSKYALDVLLYKGLCLHAKFRVNARTGEIKRLV